MMENNSNDAFVSKYSTPKPGNGLAPKMDIPRNETQESIAVHTLPNYMHLLLGTAQHLDHEHNALMKEAKALGYQPMVNNTLEEEHKIRSADGPLKMADVIRVITRRMDTMAAEIFDLRQFIDRELI